MLKTLLPLSAAVLLSGCIVHVKSGPGSAPKYFDNQQLTLSAATLKTLDTEAGAGNLSIVGSDTATEITVDAEIYAYDAEDFTLTLKEKGSRAELIARASNSNNWQVNSPGPKINLTITVPTNLNLIVDDGSGNIEIKQVSGNIDIDDGSGSITIEGGNNIIIEDGSGSMTVNNTQGDLEIDDGSGEVSVNNIAGTVTIDDGSGSINVNGAGGLVIEDSGSGGLQIKNVKGKVEIDE
ncbi:hypothetical protein C1E23_07895 [Pseudoalteromonas phenolica]|uniref:DUF4097 domain-containing protein n=1 Tax=Pseudoalteromonas phenolica TaxID=161398 RepID=A0A4Q7IMN5_9GAMM|nr:hypothetical protein [Pseudoalteromonas phenolica]RZQ53563.1 hypothetical protein C1E23_07895 [Pseudoalteromonas phenolica]TMN91336.1 hypothetical protein CWB72_06715 [Pseudoalteromonas phenolica]